MSSDIVQSLWIGPKLSELEILSIKSFINQGHIFHLYIYDDIENLPEIDNLLIKDGNTILDREEIFTFDDKNYLPFSDIFRYKMLYLNGGYWVDLDMICLKKLDFKEDYIFSSERTIQKGQYRNRTKTEISNIGILKSPKNSDFYKEVFESCLEYRNRNKKHNNLEFMVLMRKFIEKYNLNRYIKSAKLFCPLDWWHTKEAFEGTYFKEKYGVSEYNYDDFKDISYTIHMWRSLMKKRHKIDLFNIKYKDESLWKILKDKYQ